MIKEAIIKLVNKGDLTYDEAKQVMLEIMKGETTATQNAAFLAALSTKSTKAETIDEISGCAGHQRRPRNLRARCRDRPHFGAEPRLPRPARRDHAVGCACCRHCLGDQGL